MSYPRHVQREVAIYGQHRAMWRQLVPAASDFSPSLLEDSGPTRARPVVLHADSHARMVGEAAEQFVLPVKSAAEAVELARAAGDNRELHALLEACARLSGLPVHCPPPPA